MGIIFGPDGVTITRGLTMLSVSPENWSRVEIQIKEIDGVASCTILENGHMTVKLATNANDSSVGGKIDRIISGFAESPIGLGTKKGRKPGYVNSSR